jgi:ribonuclease E
VTRVEPSLQAAFVDYGGNRHGFLAFSEIHPDYYQIPVADRQALIAEEERAARAAEAEEERRAGRRFGRRERPARRPREEIRSEPIDSSEGEVAVMAAASERMAPQAGADDGIAPDALQSEEIAAQASPPEDTAPETAAPTHVAAEETPSIAGAAETPVELAHSESSSADESARPGQDTTAGASEAQDASEATSIAEAAEANRHAADGSEAGGSVAEINGAEAEEEAIESVGGSDALEEVSERMPRLRRQYKIQEVIKRRQVMLVQVVKEERGTKGAALTTYLSLAGRYSVLMPNTARGGGISRKITSAEDRRKLKEIAQELEVPEGMGVILRTAGATRTRTEVKRDFEYLLRLWEQVRDLTLNSTAPTLVYEEGSLVKRSIRDLYNKDIDEILVAGEQGHRDAKEFMRMLMPSHAKNVRLYREPVPIFTRYGIESQLDAMFQPVMQLKSGGYIVLNQAEALVAIDVNSGRATREHHIEDTALKTNLEAAEEIARQLRLRDLAGLIVIDFIDMDEKRNNRTVERRLKEALRHDRARIQVGHISHFGLLEMSRQRIRSSVLESSTEKCPHCGGTGHMRSVSSVALQLLRSLEEILLKGATHNLIVRTRTEIALYLLNHKRAHLRTLEERFHIAIMVNADANIGGQLSFVIEKGEQVHSPEQAKALAAQPFGPAPVEEDRDAYDEQDDEAEAEAEEEAIEPDGEAVAAPELARAGSEHNGGRKRRRRRRGRRAGEDRDRAPSPQEREDSAVRPEREGGALATDRNGSALAHEQAANFAPAESDSEQSSSDHAQAGLIDAGGPAAGPESHSDGERRRRRRGRRGGRRNRRGLPEGDAPSAPNVGQATDIDDAVAPEPRQAIADLDGGPIETVREQPTMREPTRTPREDARPPVAAAPEPSPPPSEAPRRRSTVREAAPLALTGETRSSAPVSEPVQSPGPQQPVATSSGEDSVDDRPRRSGWWSRRALGKE